MAEYISINELVDNLTEIINEVRAGNLNYQELALAVEKLNIYAETDFTKEKDIKTLLNIYKDVINVSLKIRQSLNKLDNEEKYDSIDYSFYYKGERFYTEELDISWLSVNKKGELYILLAKATNSIKEAIKNEVYEKISQLFKDHYEQYSNYLAGMYKKKNYKEIGGKGAKINQGHVAEAYERHLSQHHSDIYKMSKSSNDLDSSVFDSNLYNNFEKVVNSSANKNWHEGPDEVWQHLRDSMGTQRGTTAGDVLGTQIKQSKNTSRIRLITMANLKSGIKIYSQILSQDVPARDVATKIALYISDSMDRSFSGLVNGYLVPRITNDLIEMPEVNKILQKREITIYV